MEGIAPLSQQRITTRPHTHSLSSSSIQSSPVVAASINGTPQLTRTANPRTYAGARTAQPAGPAPIVTPPAPQTPASTGGTPRTPQTPATPAVVVGYNNNCPPGLYVFKDKVCPYHAQGCQYRTHIQNLLTRHVIRMHDANFRQEYRRTTRAPRTHPPAGEPDEEEEEEFGRVPPPELTPPSVRRRREPTSTRQENASFGSPDSTLSVPSPFVRTPAGPVPSFAVPASVSRPAIQSSPSSNPLVLNNQELTPASRNWVSPSIPQSLASLHDLSNPLSNSTPRPINVSPEEIFLGNRPPETEQNNVDQQMSEVKSIQFCENFSMMVCGPSDSGKTIFITQVITNRERICSHPPYRIVVVYCNAESNLTQFAHVKINVNTLDNEQYGPEYLERYFIEVATNKKEKNAPHSLVVFDDCQMKPNLVKAISALFNGNARHKNMSLIYVSQKLYDGPDQNRISTNAKYLVLFKNSRFKNESTTLNRQIHPGHPGIIAAMLEALDPHDHLLINFEPNLRDKRLQYVTNIFQTNHIVPVFVVSKSPLETSN